MYASVHAYAYKTHVLAYKMHAHTYVNAHVNAWDGLMVRVMHS